MDDLAPHVVRTDSTCGLSERDVEKAVEILSMASFQAIAPVRERP